MDLRVLGYFVAVAEERHFGRAATRLHMTQPPLSRAIRALETELGVALFERSPAGVSPTAAGAALYHEARELLERSAQIPVRVAAAAGVPTLTVGVLADSAIELGTELAGAFRVRHPGAVVRIREADLSDPTTGLRAGVADVALTRKPFDERGITVRTLRADPVGVVLRADDPLAGRPSVRLADLAGRRWFRFPDGTDPLWASFWGPQTAAGESRDDRPVVRTIHECLEAVLWNDTVGLGPLGHALPAGLAIVPVIDLPPSPLVVAWPTGTTNPLVKSFVRTAQTLYRSHKPARLGTRARKYAVNAQSQQ